jgi:hypothetical protein
MKDQHTSAESGAQWEIARKYSALFGNPPSSFTSLIRLLRMDDEKNNGAVSFHSKHQLQRLLRGLSFKSPFFFALKTYRAEQIEAMKLAAVADLIPLVKVSEIAAVLGLLYVYRRARKLCESSEWEFVTDSLHARVELGGFFGLAVPRVGFSLGLLCEGVPTLANVAFVMNDLKGFKEYRRTLKLSKKRHDLGYEAKRWGCTHVQIAASLLVSMGFGTDLVDALTTGLSSPKLLEFKPQMASAYAASVVGIWVESLLQKGREPDMMHVTAYYPEKEPLQWLLREAARTSKEGSRYTWLEKKKEDLTRAAAPELALNELHLAPAEAETDAAAESFDDEIEGLDDESP